MRRKTRFACPCCGSFTLTKEPPGTYQICPICWWEDDEVQFRDPDFAGGANERSLTEARRHFAVFGTVAEEYRPLARLPREDGPSRTTSTKHSDGESEEGV